MNKKSRITSYYFGLFAEYYIIFILFLQGYKLIKHRYKTKLGEIDIIVKKKNSLIAVEVKARKDRNLNVGEVVYPQQFYRIVNSLKIFLNKYQMYSNFDVEVDVIIVYKTFRIRHIKNVWTE